MAATRPDRTPMDEVNAPGDDPRVSRASQSQADSAVDRQARALIARIRKNWNDVEAIRALAAHYTKAGDYPSLANLMEGWGHALEDPKLAADAYVEAADALLMAGRPGDEARLLFERALSRDPSHAQALDRVTRVLEEGRNFDRLKQVLKYVAHQLQQKADNPQLLASVHYRLGQVYETHFDEPRKAATLYRQAIEENPRLVTAIAAARRLYAEQGNHKTVGVLYEFEIEATLNVEDKHALLLALARHKREQCDDLDGAVLAFRRAAKLMPNSVRALSGLAETLLARSERAEPLAAGADQQRAAEVFFHLAQRVPPNDAGQYLQRVLLVVPNHAQARAMLENLARKPSERIPQERSTSDGEAWLREPDPKPEVTELSSAELLPIDEGVRISGPPNARTPAPVRPAPPLAAGPAHPKISIAPLPDDPKRVSLEVNIGSTTDSNFYVDGSDQLIDGGVFVATYEPLDEGTLTTLTLTLPGKIIARAYGRVVITRDLMDAFDDHIPGMGIAFERIDARSFALIERFARKRAPMFLD
jgi:tetratricopeptide (TPR) repeat protein